MPKRKSIITLFSCVTIFLISVILMDFSMINAHATQGMSSQAAILARQDAVLQNYTGEDIKATQSFLLNVPYEGNGRVIDLNGDDNINIFDLRYIKQNFKVTGNYYQLLSQLQNEKSDSCASTSASGEKYTNRVIVRTSCEYDFSEYNPVAVLKGADLEYIIQFDNIADTENCISDLLKQDDVIYAEQDEYVYVPVDDCQEENAASYNKTAAAANSWGVSAIEADKYAEYLSENYSSHITVAVVDSGVSGHDFLADRLLTGYNVFNSSFNTKDDVGHGTHVAGTIVDCTPNLNIDIVPVRALRGTYDEYGNWVGSANNTQINAGIQWAIDRGVDVINLSLGGKETCQSMEYKINEAIEKGITVVVAAGNDSDDTKYYHPCNMTNECIVVSAIDSSMERAYFSNYGQSVDLSAPGVNIKSCIPNDITQADYYGYNYAVMNGTSMSAPHISAAAAMIKYAGIASSPAQVESTLISTCDDLGTSGYDIYYGHGIPKLSRLIQSNIQPSVTLSETSVSAYVGDTIQLSASCTPANAEISWSSSDKTVASVSNGRITMNSAGKATIIASFVYEGTTYSAKCSVSVKSVGLSLSHSSKTLYQTDEFTISAETVPENLPVSWSSSNSSVAYVSNGKVKALTPGTATITASVTYAGKTYSSKCTVTVKEVYVELNTHSLSMLAGDEKEIRASSQPYGLTVEWESENSMKAAVDKGLVAAKAAGSVDITASITYNGKKYTDVCSVTISEPYIKLDYNQLQMTVNETVSMSAETLPDGADISWSCDDTSVCTIDAAGQITAKSVGNAIVKGEITYAGCTYYDECSIIVGKPSVTLNKTSLSMYINDTETLVASVTAVNGDTSAGETGSDIAWSSSDSSVAVVDSNGKVKAIGEGTAVIKAEYTFYGIKYPASCTVYVSGNPGVSLNKSSVSLYIGDTGTLTADVTPSGQTVSWSTSNSGVVTVSNGKITAVGSGSATVKASIRYNGVEYYATCSVTVNKPSITLNSSSKSVYIGDAFYLYETVYPSGQSVSWTSSNTSCATVSSSGYVTAKGSGRAVITASISYAGNTYSAECVINVTEPYISMNISDTALYPGDTAIVSAETNPYGYSISYSSGNTAVASVNSSGVITGKSSGTAYITASFTYAGKTYYASQAVYVSPLSLSLSGSSGSASLSIYDESLWTHNGITEAAHKVVLPSVTYSPSSASYTWEIISGSGWIGGNQNLYVSQPGTVTARCTLSYNGYTTYKDYTFTLQWYKVTSATNNVRSGPGTGYSIVGTYPADTTLYFEQITNIGTPGESGSQIWGKVKGGDWWVIISQW